MMLFKTAQRPCCVFPLVIGCIMIAVIILSSIAGLASAASKPMTIAELALYQGPDREKILIEGAKKEGRLSLYISHTVLAVSTVKGFEKKYPFIKAVGWRSESRELLKRVTEEYAASRFLVDAIETSNPAIDLLLREGILQEFYSPELRNYDDDVKAKGKSGVFYCGDREISYGLGFNTERVPVAEAPKTLKDLLDPKWKGKMSIVGSSTGSRWIGNALDTMGRDYLEKLSRQAIRVHNISSAAMAGLVVSGEVPLSPTVPNDHMSANKKKGAPVAWIPQEPVVTTLGYSGIPAKAAHPHAALLFLDWLYSKEGQNVVMQGGLSSPRTGAAETKFKKTYQENKYSVEELEKKMSEWEMLLKRLFIEKR